MGTQSFYIPDNLEKNLRQQLDLFAKKNQQSRSEFITEIIYTYLKEKSALSLESKWADAFCGAWKDQTSSKKIVRLIEKKRSRFKIKGFK